MRQWNCKLFWACLISSACQISNLWWPVLFPIYTKMQLLVRVVFWGQAPVLGPIWNRRRTHTEGAGTESSLTGLLISLLGSLLKSRGLGKDSSPTGGLLRCASWRCSTEGGRLKPHQDSQPLQSSAKFGGYSTSESEKNHPNAHQSHAAQKGWAEVHRNPDRCN